jgi:nucleotide-binding universal stress UspA family protein
MFKRILLAYDGSEEGQKALLESHNIAQWSHAELFLVAVMPAAPVIAPEGVVVYTGPDDLQKQNYQDTLEGGLRRLADAGYPATGEVLVGDSVEAITGYARKIDADLIVVGHQHLDGWAARWWRGSKSPALIEHAHCSVLVVITH